MSAADGRFLWGSLFLPVGAPDAVQVSTCLELADQAQEGLAERPAPLVRFRGEQ